MAIADNKAMALDFVRASGANDAPALAEMITEDLVYGVQGEPHLFHFRDGKVCKVRAYVDTYHAAEVFLG
jgi:ketosteroid isomerase-like protein